MRLIISIMVVAMLCLNLTAQKTVIETVKVNQNQELSLKLDFAKNIRFKTWTKKEIQITVIVNINDNENNDLYSLELRESTSKIEFEEEIKDLEKIKKKTTIKADHEDHYITTCNINLDIEYEVYLPANYNVKLETISGNIEGQGLTGNLELKTISGNIDISLPTSIKADLDLSTISGDMFSDFDFSNKNSRQEYMNHYVKMDFNYELNGGGHPVELTTISGNIYLRKM